MFQTKVGESIKVHILGSKLFPEKLAIFEIIWRNMIEPDRLQMTTQYGSFDLYVG